MGGTNLIESSWKRDLYVNRQLEGYSTHMTSGRYKLKQEHSHTPREYPKILRTGAIGISFIGGRNAKQ